MTKVDTDPAKIEELLTRGIVEVYPSKKELEKVLREGHRIRAYVGMDATGAQLHLGHVTKLVIMERLRRMGHEVIILFGDFTSMIGDPSDKEAVRKQLTEEQVEENLVGWREQVEKVVKLDGENPARILRNSEWLSELKFKDVLELSANFTVQQMIERDMFQRRMQEEKPIYLHEFLYPVMQGYDSVAMEVDLEVGGSDQIFNMLAGRTLLKKLKDKEKYILASALLEDPETGKKMMSKSEGDLIAINDEVNNMFGKVMSLPDGAIIPLFKYATFKELGEIEEKGKRMEQGKINPRDVKLELAKEIVSMFYGPETASSAEDEFLRVFRQGGKPEEIPQVSASKGEKIGEVLKNAGVVSSTSEFNRLLEQGAIKDADTGERIDEDEITREVNLKIGKKKFVKISLSTRSQYPN